MALLYKLYIIVTSYFKIDRIFNDLKLVGIYGLVICNYYIDVLIDRRLRGGN
jgi:hypothetical protein